ncbi:MAG: 5-formyltetrahydrofolate cyclo-ligase [Candidatus Hydrogenedentes bacterium]|nr:5-formyltetrahydrofolate cyclo-ligase [Candidatus Hydrogenedentota bacterium]
MLNAELRTKYLELRRALDPADAARRSAEIIDRLRRLPAFAAARGFLIYVASKDNEVDTKPLIRSLLKHIYPVLVPVAEPGGKLLWSRLHDMADLEPARFGILEPRPDARRVTKPPADSVIVVPGVAFSVDGWRIGYGGGYFDRFLVTYGGPIVALAYDIQIVTHIDNDTHDVPMDFIVTETTTYRRPV